MNELELCMKYANTCKRCPLNRVCEGEYQREEENHERHGDLSALRNRPKRAYMSTQKETSKGWRRTGGQVPEHKSMGKQKHGDKTKG